MSIFNKKKIVICGSGGHAMSTYGLIKSISEYEIIGFLDDTKQEGEIIVDKLSVIGKISQCKDILPLNVFLAHGIVGDLNLDFRSKLYRDLKTQGYNFPKLIHPKSTVDSGVTISDGTQIHANAVIRFGSVIDENVLINSSSIVEHQCKIGKNSVLSPGALLCGKVVIGEKVFIGANSTILQNLDIENNVIVGANSLILRNIPSYEKVYGIVKNEDT